MNKAMMGFMVMRKANRLTLLYILRLCEWALATSDILRGRVRRVDGYENR